MKIALIFLVTNVYLRLYGKTLVYECKWVWMFYAAYWLNKCSKRCKLLFCKQSAYERMEQMQILCVCFCLLRFSLPTTTNKVNQQNGGTVNWGEADRFWRFLCQEMFNIDVAFFWKILWDTVIPWLSDGTFKKILPQSQPCKKKGLKGYPLHPKGRSEADIN